MIETRSPETASDNKRFWYKYPFVLDEHMRELGAHHYAWFYAGRDLGNKVPADFAFESGLFSQREFLVSLRVQSVLDDSLFTSLNATKEKIESIGGGIIYFLTENKISGQTHIKLADRILRGLGVNGSTKLKIEGKIPKAVYEKIQNIEKVSPLKPSQSALRMHP